MKDIRSRLSHARKDANLSSSTNTERAMMKLSCGVALIAIVAVAASSPAAADGALAVGSTSDVAKDGIAVGTSINYKSAEEAVEAALKRCSDYKPAPKAAALCMSIGSFKGECYAVSFDPKAGTPGAGWAIASTKALAEERAIANCKITAGANRREFCKIEESKCDEN
jgi:hypothetical protein